jgi:hypothetical protein
MRAALIASIAAIGLVALPAQSQAAPGAVHGPSVARTAPELIPVRDGCGPGWHRQGWRDRWGRWRSRCVPNRW